MPRILIVDDENNIRLMMRLALQAAGHEVATAADGADGLDQFADGGTCDLVLLDQRMPGMEGLEVLHTMRRRQPDAQVIMITAFGTIDLATEALQAGAAGFLRKPFTMEVLRGAVAAVLREAPAPPALPSASLSLGFTSINGYRIEADEATPVHTTPVHATPATGPESKADPDAPAAPFRQHFQVRGPRHERRPCDVLLPPYFIDSVQAHAHAYPLRVSESFWRGLCAESLANYLWQNAELPPGGLLQVDELTPGLRRWMDSVLVGQQG